MHLSDSRLRSLVSCQTNFVSETVRHHHGNWQASFARTCILKWLSSVLLKVPWLKHCHHDISVYTNYILYSLYNIGSIIYMDHSKRLKTWDSRITLYQYTIWVFWIIRKQVVLLMRKTSFYRIVEVHSLTKLRP